LPTKHYITLPTAASHHDRAAYFDLGEGEPILFLHGFMGEATCWLPTMERLQHHHRCIGLDLLGFGESSQPPIRYDIAQEVAFVRQVLAALNISRCTVVGHSLGGWVAAALAIAAPEQVERLWLIAPAGIRDDEFCQRYNHLRPLLWPSRLIDWILALMVPVAQFCGRGKGFETIRGFRRELQRQPAAKSFLLDRLRPEDAIDTVETQISQILAPTIVVAGAADDTIPLWHCQTYADRIPQSQLHCLANVDHAIPQNQSEWLATAIRQAGMIVPC
jgi:pimeloyl-ACP methyl ester carboxylesterase